MKRLMVVLLLCAGSFSQAFAWGDLGHRVICQIAYLELKPEIKVKVDALLALEPGNPSFAASCNWPDRFPRIRPPEHYVNVARDAGRIDVARPCPMSDRCVVTAVLSDARDLALSTDSIDRLRHLKSLGHWVGDLHQPLHVSFEDDRGGNAIKVSGLCGQSLHAVWDSCIIQKRLGFDFEQLAADFRSSVSDDDRKIWVPSSIEPSDILAWANESFAAAKAVSTKYCGQQGGFCRYDEGRLRYDGGVPKTVVIDELYLKDASLVVKVRLSLAGLRLGAMLNVLLADDQVGEFP